MLELETIVVILNAHFYADFVMQSNWMATNKSSSLKALLVHVAIYTVVLWATCFAYFHNQWSFQDSIRWALVNGLCHLITDGISSKGTKYFFGKKDYHNGFVIVGLDQLAHYVVLFGSL